MAVPRLSLDCLCIFWYNLCIIMLYIEQKKDRISFYKICKKGKCCKLLTAYITWCYLHSYDNYSTINRPTSIGCLRFELSRIGFSWHLQGTVFCQSSFQGMLPILVNILSKKLYLAAVLLWRRASLCVVGSFSSSVLAQSLSWIGMLFV